MKKYAFIQGQKVAEIIGPVFDEAGEYVPIADRFAPDFVAAMVDITDLVPVPEAGWSYDGAAFHAPAPPPAASAVPEFVTMAQARLELLADGHLSAIQQAIAAMPGTAGDVARIEWEFRPTVRRDSALVALMVQGLGLTSAQADQMFINAAAR